jgi:hypothetical protein
MQKIIFSLVATLVFLFMTTSAFAAGGSFFTPLSINGVPPVQFPPSDYSVTGARLNALIGKQRDVFGLDLGVIGGITDNTFTGIALSGIFNYTKGTTNAILLQGAGLTNVNTGKAAVYGLMFAGLVNMNTAESKVVGVQMAALANLGEFTDIYGFQVGLYNRAKEVYGFQVGLVNVATNLHGIQLGLANINQQGTIRVAPFLNVGF